MSVLGIDTGRWVGWSVIDASATGPKFAAAGVLDVEHLGEDGVREELLVVAARHGVRLVGIERVRRVQAHLAFQRGAASMASALVLSSWLGGTLAEALRGGAREVRTFAAEDVRRHFIAPSGPVGRGQKKPDMDGVVAAAVRQHVTDWAAKIPGEGEAYRKDGSDLMADKRAHAHDAALVALYAAHLARTGASS